MHPLFFALLQESFETRFPCIAELASHECWFAVVNVIRRRVVPAFEYTATHIGKTAAEWADFHQNVGIALELRFYVSIS